jgi:23S rRNA pseudouridine2605 synthase
MRLNKYLAQSGIASRRGSDRLIKAATTTVNNIVITDPAYDIKDNDIVRYDGKKHSIK